MAISGRMCSLTLTFQDFTGGVGGVLVFRIFASCLLRFGSAIRKMVDFR